MDFADLKARCKGWLDEHWDHSFLVSDQDENAIAALKMVQPFRLFVMPYNPTAENMAKYLLEEVCPKILLGTGSEASRVRIWETEESYAEAGTVKSRSLDVPHGPSLANRIDTLGF